jgi:hypothetical protein
LSADLGSRSDPVQELELELVAAVVQGGLVAMARGCDRRGSVRQVINNYAFLANR